MCNMIAFKHLGNLQLTNVSTVNSREMPLPSSLPPYIQHALQIVPVVVSDAEALAACGAFATERRMLVEPACGAALAVLERPEYQCACAATLMGVFLP